MSEGGGKVKRMTKMAAQIWRKCPYKWSAFTLTGKIFRLGPLLIPFLFVFFVFFVIFFSNLAVFVIKKSNNVSRNNKQ